jgi:hypothetical protein
MQAKKTVNSWICFASFGFILPLLTLFCGFWLYLAWAKNTAHVSRAGGIP